MEEFNEKVRSGLVLGYQSSHLRVNGLPQRLEQREVTARIYKFKIDRMRFCILNEK